MSVDHTSAKRGTLSIGFSQGPRGMAISLYLPGVDTMLVMPAGETLGLANILRAFALHLDPGAVGEPPLGDVSIQQGIRDAMEKYQRGLT